MAFPGYLVMVCGSKLHTQLAYAELRGKYGRETARARFDLTISPIEISRSYLRKPVRFVLAWTEDKEKLLRLNPSDWVVIDSPDPVEQIVERIEEQRGHQLSNLFSTAGRFKRLGLEKKDDGIAISLQYYYRGARTHISLNVEESELMAELTAMEAVRFAYDYLEETYPHLVFSLDGKEISTWCKDLRGRSRESTGKQFTWPLSDADKASLTALDRLAIEALDPGFFYCTVCGKVRPREELAHTHFALWCCTDCSTPELKRQAEEETYN